MRNNNHHHNENVDDDSVNDISVAVHDDNVLVPAVLMKAVIIDESNDNHNDKDGHNITKADIDHRQDDSNNTSNQKGIEYVLHLIEQQEQIQQQQKQQRDESDDNFSSQSNGHNRNDNSTINEQQTTMTTAGSTNRKLLLTLDNTNNPTTTIIPGAYAIDGPLQHQYRIVTDSFDEELEEQDDDRDIAANNNTVEQHQQHEEQQQHSLSAELVPQQQQDLDEEYYIRLPPTAIAICYGEEQQQTIVDDDETKAGVQQQDRMIATKTLQGQRRKQLYTVILICTILVLLIIGIVVVVYVVVAKAKYDTMMVELDNYTQPSATTPTIVPSMAPTLFQWTMIGSSSSGGNSINAYDGVDPEYNRSIISDGYGGYYGTDTSISYNGSIVAVAWGSQTMYFSRRRQLQRQLQDMSNSTIRSIPQRSLAAFMSIYQVVLYECKYYDIRHSDTIVLGTLQWNDGNDSHCVIKALLGQNVYTIDQPGTISISVSGSGNRIAIADATMFPSQERQQQGTRIFSVMNSSIYWTIPNAASIVVLSNSGSRVALLDSYYGTTVIYNQQNKELTSSQDNNNTWDKLLVIVPGRSHLNFTSIDMSSDGGTIAIGIDGGYSNIDDCYLETNSSGYIVKVLSIAEYTTEIDMAGQQQHSNHTYRIMNWTDISTSNVIMGDAAHALLNRKSISLSANGTILAIGSSTPLSCQVINVGPSDTGFVRVFKRHTSDTSSTWEQLGQTLYGGVDEGDKFGTSIKLSASGRTLIVGSKLDDQNGLDSGLVKVYRFNNGQWDPIGQDIIGDPGSEMGTSVSLAGDGNTILSGAPNSNKLGEKTGEVQLHHIQVV